MKLITLALIGTSAFCQGTALGVSCESLARLDLREITIMLAQPVAAGQFKAPRPTPSLPMGPVPNGGAPPRGMRGPFGETDASPVPAFSA